MRYKLCFHKLLKMHLVLLMALVNVLVKYKCAESHFWPITNQLFFATNGRRCVLVCLTCFTKKIMSGAAYITKSHSFKVFSQAVYVLSQQQCLSLTTGHGMDMFTPCGRGWVTLLHFTLCLDLLLGYIRFIRDNVDILHYHSDLQLQSLKRPMNRVTPFRDFSWKLGIEIWDLLRLLPCLTEHAVNLSWPSFARIPAVIWIPYDGYLVYTQFWCWHELVQPN